MPRITFWSLVSLMFATPIMAERIPSHCLAYAQNEPRIYRAATIPEDAVAISYIDHSMYLIETPSGYSAVTDYAGGRNGGDGDYPELVTMNYAHSSHHASHIAPEIEHALRGVGADGSRADHYVETPEMIVRNVTTDTRSRWDGTRVPDANSIFIFEVAGLCIGHLGHLHHEPSEEQYIQMGRLDIVMAAIDGGMTLDTDTMVRILKRVRASVVLPMHWRGNYALDQFKTQMADEFLVTDVDTEALIFSIHSLPARPTVMVMQPKYLPNYYQE